MWLVLCASNDHPALWAARRLRARGVSPLLTLTPELLHYSVGWEHRLGPARTPSVAFTLASGRHVRGEDVRGVLNRLTALPEHLVARFAAPDRAYALQEWTALHTSWLSSLPGPVLNQPAGSGLGGAIRHPSEWIWLAARAGLATVPFRSDIAAAEGHHAESARGPRAPRTVFVVDGEAVGSDGAGDDVLPQVSEGCGRLARLAGTRLLGIQLEPGTDRFITATPHPDLRRGGERLIAAIDGALTGRA